MNKKEFIKQLQKRLKGQLPADEVSEVANYYEELIAERLDLGEDEAGIITSLGSINKIVGALTLKSIEKKEPSKNLGNILFSTKSLLRLATTPLLVLLAFIFSVLMFTLVISLGAVLLSLVVSLIGIIVSLIDTIGLAIVRGASFGVWLFAIGGHIFVFGAFIAGAILLKDLIFFLINKSLFIFTKLFKKQVNQYA